MVSFVRARRPNYRINVADEYGRDHAAVVRAVTAWKDADDGADLYFPAGVYGLEDEVNVFAEKDNWKPRRLTISGDGEASVLEANFAGANKALLNATHPTVETTRGSGPRIRNLLLRCENGLSGVGPVLFKHLNASSTALQDVSFIHGADNSAIQMSNCYNVDLFGIDVWSSGYCVPYRRVDNSGAVVYSITSGSDELAADVDTFEAGDVDKWILMRDASTSVALVAQITTFTNAQSVTLDREMPVSSSAIGVYFETVRGSMSAGSAVLTLESDVLSSADVGRAIIVAGGATTLSGTAKRYHHAFISTVDAADQATLSIATTNAMTDVPVFFSPAVDLFCSDSDFINDLQISKLRIPPYLGCGLYVGPGASVTLDAKIHGVNPGYAGSGTTDFSHASLVWEASGSKVSRLHLDGSVAAPWRSLVNGLNAGATFDWVAGQINDFQKTIRMENCHAGASLTVGPLDFPNRVQSDVTNQNPVSSDGTGRLFMMGGMTSSNRAVYGIGARPAFLPGGMNANGSSPLQIADDAVATFQLPYFPGTYKSGIITIWAQNVISATAIIAFSYNGSSSTVSIVSQTSGAVFEVSTSDVAGTTGTDGKITFSLQADGTCKIENRRGGYTYFGWAFLV